MVFVEIHGLWNGQLVFDNASVTQLADDLEDQQKQIVTLTLQKMIAPNKPPEIEPAEDIGAFATRVGFTRLDYYYQKNNTWFVVDILDSTTRH
jgi:hypothetical protein